MEKVTIKNLIDFRAKSDRSKITFLNNLRKEKIKDPNEEGGDYWISCVSTISNVYRNNDRTLLGKKVTEIQAKLKGTTRKQTRDQYQWNIDILIHFEDFDLQTIRPNVDLQIQKQSKANSLLDINGLPIEAKPSHVFSFSENGSDEIGAVWFVAKKGGYHLHDLGMFADIIYRYLDSRYSKEYFVSTSFCIAVDVFSGKVVRYKDIESGIIPTLIDATIDQINKL